MKEKMTRCAREAGDIYSRTLVVGLKDILTIIDETTILD